jgi:methionine sulfoxide reductase heme-binding subunit
VVFVVFMSVPLFDASVYPHPDLMSGPFPKLRAGSGTGPTDHGTTDTRPMGHTGHHTGSMAGHSDHTGSRNHVRGGATSADHDRDLLLSRRIQQSTVATGYLALGLLAVTLLLGPANLLLRRRNPVSSYLRRDVGMWTAIFSVVHVSQAVLTHVSHGGELISSFGHFFVAEDGNPLTNSFGLGNWTGLAALVIVVGLLAFSTDFALGKLKARPWKWLQRLNYALFALVIAHAFFYGALFRRTSPFTFLLGLSVIAVFVGQAVGVWLWRARNSHTAAQVA